MADEAHSAEKCENLATLIPVIVDIINRAPSITMKY